MKGRCYRLYTEEMFENDFRSYDRPEILRTPIDSLLLRVMIGDETHPIAFFEAAVDPPERSKIRSASLRLRDLGMIEISSQQEKKEYVVSRAREFLDDFSFFRVSSISLESTTSDKKTQL